MKKALSASVILAAALTATGVPAAAPARPAEASPEMRQMMKTYTPEMRQKVMALSPQLKATIQQLHAGHPRRARETTLRQIMLEILSEYQAIAMAIAVDNPEAAADAARRLAGHRIPKGGLLPYFPLDQVTDADLGVLPAMNEAVEGSALKLAEAADAGDMPRAASYLSDIMTGCVACHVKFRPEPPGLSANLIAVPAK